MWGWGGYYLNQKEPKLNSPQGKRKLYITNKQTTKFQNRVSCKYTFYDFKIIKKRGQRLRNPFVLLFSISPISLNRLHILCFTYYFHFISLIIIINSFWCLKKWFFSVYPFTLESLTESSHLGRQADIIHTLVVQCKRWLRNTYSKWKYIFSFYPFVDGLEIGGYSAERKLAQKAQLIISDTVKWT